MRKESERQRKGKKLKEVEVEALNGEASHLVAILWHFHRRLRLHLRWGLWVQRMWLPELPCSRVKRAEGRVTKKWSGFLESFCKKNKSKSMFSWNDSQASLMQVCLLPGSRKHSVTLKVNQKFKRRRHVYIMFTALQAIRSSCFRGDSSYPADKKYEKVYPSPKAYWIDRAVVGWGHTRHILSHSFGSIRLLHRNCHPPA